MPEAAMSRAPQRSGGGRSSRREGDQGRRSSSSGKSSGSARAGGTGRGSGDDGAVVELARKLEEMNAMNAELIELLQSKVSLRCKAGAGAVACCQSIGALDSNCITLYLPVLFLLCPHL